MNLSIFVAGSTGAIGARLLPMLLARGHRVFGLTRSPDRAAALQQQGATPVIADVFEPEALIEALRAARPDVVVHQLTDLPRGLAADRMEEGIRRNARIRREGTANLVAAATAAGATKLVAQSVAWLYAPGDEPHPEEDRLDLEAQGLRAISVDGVATLERTVLGAAGLQGIVLRYGQLWGPGTGSESAEGKELPLHVDGAAWAAVLAIERGWPGIYNVVGDNRRVLVDKAGRELGWTESGWTESGWTESGRRAPASA